MSTIPLIFNPSMPSYTAVGGAGRAASTGLSALLLNRGIRYPRRTLFQELEKAGFDYVVSIEGPQERYDLEELSSRFPFVRFILLKETISLGEQINLAVSEISTPLFFVLWNDLRILHSGKAGRVAERLLCSAEELKAGNPGPYKRLCTTPVIQNSHFETLSTLVVPASIHRGKNGFPPGTSPVSGMAPYLIASQREGAATLYPFDGVGIYDRDRFIKLGGFDPTLKSPYWQLMDFGFRAHLWGESIRCTQFVRLSYNGDAPSIDGTVEESYCRFYLKNMAPVFHGDHAQLPWRRFPGYFLRSRRGIFLAWSDFTAGRKWVDINRFRFRSDARLLIELWENPDEEELPAGNGGSAGTVGNSGGNNREENKGRALLEGLKPDKLLEGKFAGVGRPSTEADGKGFKAGTLNPLIIRGKP